jgi:hypothetical protein
VALLEEITRRLSTAGVGSTHSTAAWRIVFREFLPGSIGGSTKGQQIAIVPTGGFQQFSERAPIDRPTFQIMVRGNSTGSTGLEAKVDAVISALNFFAGTLSSRVYVDISKQGEAHYLGRDENQRPLYSINFLAHRSRTT